MSHDPDGQWAVCSLTSVKARIGLCTLYHAHHPANGHVIKLRNTGDELKLQKMTAGAADAKRTVQNWPRRSVARSL